MPIRNGKIANLPNAIREQLNLRLLEGETGRELAAWLNALPEVQSILGSHFNGAPVSEVNLTHWRQGGYLQWLTERECFDSARALAEGDGDLASTGLSAERLLNVLTVRFGQLLMRWDSSADGSISESVAFSEIAKKARILQGISRSVLAIHRIQLQSALKKSSAATFSANSHARPQQDTTPNRAEAAKRIGGPASSHASPEQNAKPIPATPSTNGRSADGRSTEGKATSDPRDARMPVSYPKCKSANEEGTLRNGTIFSLAGRPANPKILSGPIIPSILTHTPFNPGNDLDEILKAI